MNRLSALLLTLLLTASACSSQATEEEPETSTTTAPSEEQPTSTVATTTSTQVPATTTTTEPPIEWDFSPSETPPVVTLLEPGSEPREVRVYSMTKGSLTQTTMRFGLSIAQLVGGISTIDLDTEVDLEMLIEVTDVVPEGYVITSAFGASRVSASDAATEESLNLVYSSLAGTKTTQLTSPTGQVLAVAVDQQSGDFGDITAGLASSVAPFPVEPIGIGARWEVVGQIETQGIVVVQTSTITLLDIEGSLLTVEMETVQELGPDGMEIPGVEVTDATLSSLSSGEAVWDLSQPIPGSASSEGVQTLALTLVLDGEEATLDQTSTASFELPSPAVFGAPEGTQSFDVEDRTHFEGALEYEQDPPVGGNHNPVWQNCGFYNDPVASENAVHSLEHGAVWITFAPDVAADEMEALRELAQTPLVLVSPYPGLDSNVVASAWGVQLRLDSAFDPRLAEFVDWFAGGPQSPEPGAACSGGTGDPE